MLYSVEKVAQRCFSAGRDLVRSDVYDWVYQAYDDVWQAGLWPFLRADGQIVGEADITTGTVALTQGGWSATFSSDPGEAAVGMHLRASGFVRGYRLEAYEGAGVFRMSAPWGEDTDAAATYELRRLEFRGPVDFWRLDLAANAEALSWVDDITARMMDRQAMDPWATGDPYMMSLVGGARRELYSGGVVTIAAGSATVDLVGGTFPTTIERRRFVLPDAPELGWFKVMTRVSGTQLTLDRPIYYRGGSGIRYQIDPAGEPLYRFYPQPVAYQAVEFKYFRQLPPLQGPDDLGQLPTVFQEAWVERAKLLCGIQNNNWMGELRKLQAESGMSARPVVRAGTVDGPMDVGRRGSVLPSNFEFYRPRGR